MEKYRHKSLFKPGTLSCLPPGVRTNAESLCILGYYN
jgi:hypothetical protein